jgi:hypothetical protein
MAVYGAMSALGITAGVLLGGLGAAAGIAAMTAISTSVSDARIPHAGSTLQRAGTNLASVASDPEALAACYATAFLAGSAAAAGRSRVCAHP